MIQFKDRCIYPDHIEQFLCERYGFMQCALTKVQNEQNEDVLVLSFPEGEQFSGDHKRLLAELKDLDIPVEVILNLPSSLPVDARHNSKIDRTLLAQIAQSLIYECDGGYGDEAVKAR